MTSRKPTRQPPPATPEPGQDPEAVRVVEPDATTPVPVRVTEPAPVDPGAGTGYLRAAEPLYVGSTLCHMPGDLVPAENVARHGWQAKVIPLGADDARRSAAEH